MSRSGDTQTKATLVILLSSSTRQEFLLVSRISLVFLAWYLPLLFPVFLTLGIQPRASSPTLLLVTPELVRAGAAGEQRRDSGWGSRSRSVSLKRERRLGFRTSSTWGRTQKPELSSGNPKLRRWRPLWYWLQALLCFPTFRTPTPHLSLSAGFKWFLKLCRIDFFF